MTQQLAAVTATMNFVVYFEDAAISGWIRERTRRIGEKHPSRVIVLDDTRAPAVEAPDAGSARSEWIEVGTQGCDGGSLAATISAHALPEAPLVLAWIASKISADDRFPALAKRAHTVICNSSVTDVGSNSLRDFIEFAGKHPGIDVQDLAYVRLHAWQDLIAEFFDEERVLEDLFKLRNVEITAGSEAEAYYLLGWLASRLEWAACGKERMCNREKETITFSIHRDGAPRRISRVALMTDSTTYTARVFDEDPNVARVEVTGTHPQRPRCIPLHDLDVASLIGRAILQTRRDPVFHETLTLTKRLLDSQRS
ncbi:MAG: glucose-6-phosphate dehydrogenase assembly protein OpcA [Candidatus Baltobacteraceae bacterium]